MKIFKPLLFSLISLISTCTYADRLDTSPNETINELRPFTTDGCSVVPDFEFTSCCVAHDLDYWKGGTEEQRLTADENLRLCIKEKSNPLMASIFYWGVRIGGGPEKLSTYRWGYGWKFIRKYGPLNEDELSQISQLDPGDIYSYEIIDPERNYTLLPSKNNNYCMDDIYRTIKKRYKTEDIQISRMRTEQDYYFTKIKIWLNNSERIIFTYPNKKFEQCTTPRYFLGPIGAKIKFH